MEFYTVPFKKRPIHIGQGFKGPTHRVWKEDKEDLVYSIDFLLPVGTPILAARSGKITRINTRNGKNYKGKDPKKGELAHRKWMNEIEILHGDGSYASYCHLKNAKPAVRPNQRVEQGQLIGFSGNTGWSSKPHLDFTVFRKNFKGYKIKSIKFKFKDCNKSLQDS